MDQELISPAVEGVETLGIVDVVDEHTAVGTTIESNAERLESLLSSSIPELAIVSDVLKQRVVEEEWLAHLHGD